MPTTSSSRRLRRAGAVTAALSVLALSAGCSLLPTVQARSASSPAPSPAASAMPSAAASTPTADVGDVVMDADYGSAKATGKTGQDLTVTLTGVHRVSDDVALVSVTITAENISVLNEMFSEANDADPDNAFSAVTITVDGDDDLYQSVRDAGGHCMCSTVPSIAQGRSTGAWAYVTVPPGATTVNVAIAKLQPWVGVPVS